MKVKKHNTTYTGLIQRCKEYNKIVIYVQKNKKNPLVINGFFVTEQQEADSEQPR